MKKPDHCKGCLLLSAHKNKNNLTEAQKKTDNWCCAKGQPAVKSVAYCKIHKLKKM
jgi:hypothetical protein